MTLIFATIIHSGHNNLVEKENITALGETMVSVVLNMNHVLTKVTKSFILDSLVIRHIIARVRMFSTALALVQVLLVMRVPVVT